MILLKKAFLPLLLIALVAVGAFLVFTGVDTSGISRSLGNANYGIVLLALGVYLFSTLFWAARWHVALSAVGYSVGLRNLYLLIYGSIFFNNVTPFTYSGGDPFFRVYLLKKTQSVAYSSGFATIIGEYMLDLPVFLSFLMLGLLTHFYTNTWIALTVMAIWIAVVISLSLVFPSFLRSGAVANRMSGIVVRVLKVFRRRAVRGKISRDVEKFRIGALSIIGYWKVAFSLIVFSIILWSFAILRLFLIFLALGYPPQIQMLLLAITLPSIAGLMPFLPGGLGAVDATMISVFLLSGVPLELAVSATLIERAISLVFSTLVGACTLSYLGIKVWAGGRRLTQEAESKRS